jgi:hypothetical protein
LFRSWYEDIVEAVVKRGVDIIFANNRPLHGGRSCTNEENQEHVINVSTMQC